MIKIDRTKLLYGPYRAPQVRPSDRLFDQRYGTVKTGGYTNAPIPWPRLLKTGRHAPILCGDLLKAVKHESELAVAHHWGVSVTTVWAWRKALDVGRITSGTARLYVEYKPAKLTPDRTAKGRANCGRPEHRQASRDRLLGKPAHPNTAAALRIAAKKPKRKSHRQSLSIVNHDRIMREWSNNRPSDWPARESRALKAGLLAPAPSPARRWLAEEIDLLGNAPDSVIANLLGRSRASVALARLLRKIKTWSANAA